MPKLNKLLEIRNLNKITGSRRYFFWLLITIFFIAFLGILFRIFWLIPRSDEVITMMVSSVESLPLLLKYMHEGIDVSYLHNIIIFTLKEFADSSVLLQRFFSLSCWFVSLMLIYKILKRTGLDREIAMVAVFVIAFSRLGIFLATDGRFYSLLFFCCSLHLILLIKLITEEYRNAWLIIMILISIMGVLTTPLYLVYLVFINSVILFHFIFKHLTVNKLVVVFEVFIASGFYYLFLHKGISHEILTSYAEPRATGNEVGFSYLAEQFFKWFALPEMHGIPIAVSCALFLIIASTVVFNFFFNTQKVSNLNIPKKLFFFAGILSLITLFAVFIYSRYISAKPWEFRYFTPVFFFAGIALIIIVSTFKDGYFKNLIISSFAIILFLQAVSVVKDGFDYRKEKISFRKEIDKVFQTRLKANVLPEKYIFMFNKAEDIRFYGQVYSMYPEQRQKLRFVITDLLQKNTNTFNLIAKNIKSSGYIFEQKLTENNLKHSVLISSERAFKINNILLDSDELDSVKILNEKHYFKLND